MHIHAHTHLRRSMDANFHLTNPHFFPFFLFCAYQALARGNTVFIRYLVLPPNAQNTPDHEYNALKNLSDVFSSWNNKNEQKKPPLYCLAGRSDAYFFDNNNSKQKDTNECFSRYY